MKQYDECIYALMKLKYSGEHARLLYMWIKQGEINLKTFKKVLERYNER